MRRTPILTLALLALASSPARGQSLAIGLKGGTIGFGADVGLGLGPFMSIRGGVGLFPFDIPATFSDIEYNVEPPPRFLLGVLDIHLMGPFRITGGVLNRSQDVRATSDLSLTGDVEIGDVTYSEDGVLTGILTGKTTAPYAGIGFGRTAGPTSGIYVDIGVAFTGKPGVQLEATGPITDVPGFDAELEKERLRIEDELERLSNAWYYQVWPVVNFGIRLGFG